MNYDKELIEPNIVKIAELRENLAGMKGSLDEKRVL